MDVQTVLDHPKPGAFMRAAALRFIEGAKAAGHSTGHAYLYADGFHPRWTVPDPAQFEDMPMPADGLAEQGRIDRADAMRLAFPLF